MSNTSVAPSVDTSSATTKISTTTTTTATTTVTTILTTNATTHTNVPRNPYGLSDGQQAGIAVGVIVFVIVIVAIIVFIVIWKRRRDRRPTDEEPIDEGKKEHAQDKQKRPENKYVKKGPPNVDKQDAVYENPENTEADPQNYYNVEEQNTDSDVNADHSKRIRKPAIEKQNSIPTVYAPPPPSMEESRTSMPVEIAPICPVIGENLDDEDEYIFPEDPSKIHVAKRPPNTGRKPQISDGELYIDMSSTPGEELYIDPDSGQEQKSYMNFDAKSKPVEDEERKGGPKDYVNLSKEKKGVPFGVHPKDSNAALGREETIPVTINDEESYQNVFYENRSKQKKKPQRKN